MEKEFKMKNVEGGFEVERIKEKEFNELEFLQLVESRKTQKEKLDLIKGRLRQLRDKKNGKRI